MNKITKANFKKLVLVLTLTLVMTLGMSISVFAATGAINGIRYYWLISYNSYNSKRINNI